MTITGPAGGAPTPPLPDPNFQQGAEGDTGGAVGGSGVLAVPIPEPAPIPQPGAPVPGAPYFTADQIEAARKQERDKLYPQLEAAETARKEAEKQLKAREKAEDEERKRIAEEQRIAAEAEMDARQLIETRTAEFQAQLAEERAARERTEAMLVQEQRLSDLERNRSVIVARESENIMPELIDLISGNTTEEMEQSAASLRDRTASILANVSAAGAQVRQQMQGASVTAPPVGPLEQQAAFENVTAADIAAMDIQAYAANRDRLRGALSANVKANGLYGP